MRGRRVWSEPPQTPKWARTDAVRGTGSEKKPPVLRSREKPVFFALRVLLSEALPTSF